MELEWWVSVGWFTVINIMMLYVCGVCECVPVSGGLSVVRCVVCMAGWLLLGVCVFAYPSVFVIMCVYIYSVSTCVCDKCVIVHRLIKKGLRALWMCVYMFLCFPIGRGHTPFLSFTVPVCICELLPKPVCFYWTSKPFSQHWHMPRKTREGLWNMKLS